MHSPEQFPRGDAAPGSGGTPPVGAILLPPFPDDGTPDEPACLAHALWCLTAGLAPVVLMARGEVYTEGGVQKVSDGKRPRSPGFGRMDRRETEQSLRDAFAAHPDSGLGLLLGMRRDGPGAPGGVVDVEIDDPLAAAPVIDRIWPDGLPDTLRWEANGPGRWHLLFAIDGTISQALINLGIEAATLKGRHRVRDDEFEGDPSYAGLEFRFGTLSPYRVRQAQSVAPPTPRADGTRRAYEGNVILPFPRALIDDLARHSQCAESHFWEQIRRTAPRKPLPREELLGLSAYEKVKTQLKVLRIRFSEGQTENGQAAIYTSCPAHPDNKPSARFAEKEAGGKLVVDCYSRGCELAGMMEPLGLFACDAYPDSAAKRRATVEDMIRRKVSNINWNGSLDPAGMDEVDRERIDHEDARCCEALLARPERLQELADLMGVSEDALWALHPGWRERNRRKDEVTGEWHDLGPAWTFSMLDGRGWAVNLQRRFVDPSVPKRGLSGGRQGLFVPRGWQERPGPVFLVEGVSDTATLWDLGLCAIGRPNNTQGVAYAAALLKGVGHEVVVVGENDRKADGRWPGDPRPFARDLHERLGRAVKAVLPPATAKDVRAWRTTATDEAVRDTLLRLAASASPVVETSAAGPGVAPGGFRVQIPLRVINQ